MYIFYPKQIHVVKFQICGQDYLPPFSNFISQFFYVYWNYWPLCNRLLYIYVVVAKTKKKHKQTNLFLHMVISNRQNKSILSNHRHCWGLQVMVWMVFAKWQTSESQSASSSKCNWWPVCLTMYVRYIRLNSSIISGEFCANRDEFKSCRRERSQCVSIVFCIL